MVTAFEKFILENQLCKKDQPVLLAVSGGVDSVAMTDLFIRTGHSVALAHVNFGLRGTASNEDQELVKSLAASLGVSCHVTKFNTKDISKQRKVSTQMAARELRYQWFKELCQEHQYDCVATAHHLDDVIETVYFNLTKGTGIAGLHGIPPKKGCLIRPILFATKEAICNYARERELTWREDESNASAVYARNLIRHKVLPLLREINPNLEQTMQQTVEKLKAVEHIFQEKVHAAEQAYISKKGSDIFVDKRLLTEEASVTVLELLKPFGFNFQQVKQLMESDHQSGKVFLSSSHQLNVDRSGLVISQLEKNGEQYLLFPDKDGIGLDHYDLRWVQVPAKDLEIPTSAMEAALDFDRLTFPLKIRPWQSGDRLCPLGMSQTKKISDLLIDVKVPLNLKQRVNVLLSGGLVAWVIGFSIDDRFKITRQTRRVLHITCHLH